MKCEEGEEGEKQVRFEHNIIGATLRKCRIERDAEKGRKCIATTDVKRGEVLLREPPFLQTLSSSSSSYSSTHNDEREENGDDGFIFMAFLLPEHVSMAWKMGLSTYSDGNSSSVRDADEIKAYHQFLHEVQSHITIEEGGKLLILTSYHNVEVDGQWSTEQIIFFWSVASLCSLVSSQGNKAASTVEMCICIFETLIRLPTNCHSMSSLVNLENDINNVNDDSTVNTMYKSVEQRRQKISLFLQASSINHSCIPNAVYRFDANDQLELISLTNIAAHTEVVISYGPLAGIHSLESRRNSLLEQYLFICCCNICMQEEATNKNTRDNAHHTTGSSGDDETIAYIKKYLEVEVTDDYDVESVLSTIRCRLTDDSPKGHVMILCEALDKIAKYYAEAGRYQCAATLILEAIDRLISAEIFDTNDVTMARERVKASGLFALFDIQRAKHLATQALETLQITCSADDMDLLEAIRICSSSSSSY